MDKNYRPTDDERIYEDIILAANHTLIAGCSGSGKSTAENAIIYRALTNGKPNLFVLIDLKRVELRAYKDLVNTIWYADTIEATRDALEGTLNTIENRFAEMQKLGLKKTREADIYVVIDEYADMVLMDKSLERYIQRISQIGRAAGVHLIICTQRPCSEVISGAVKVNLETRLALRTMTAQDSRNIIGISGAEELPRYGYGILMDCGYHKYTVIEKIDDDRMQRVLDYYKPQKGANA